MKYLFEINGNFNFGDIVRNKTCERININWLSHDTGHCKFCKVIGKTEAGVVEVGITVVVL